MNGRSQYLLSLGAMLLMSACYKDDLDPAQLTNNPFDPEYVGENVFVSEGTYTETVFVPQIGNVLRQVIAFRVRSELFLSDVTYSVRVHDLENDQTILLDAYNPSLYGGTGETFPWELAVQARELFPDKRIILSGGLTPTNVRHAIEETHPAAVDVASGVEVTPGIKDLALVSEFIQQARSAQT